MIISNQRSLFSIPESINYLNCATMSPSLKSISDAGIAAIGQRNEPWTIPSKQWFEPAAELKTLFAEIINSSAANIALVPSASYGIALAKQNIKLNASQEILVLDQQYPSNFYAWRELSRESGAKIITVKKEPSQAWTEAVLDKISDRTGLVSVPNCHWTNGGLLDLITISKRVRETGAKLVIDASQSAGAYPMDIQKIKPDFLVTVGYKWLLGPYGLAYFYADEKYFNEGKPIEYSWLGREGSEDFTKLVDYTDAYRPGAGRFDAGAFPAFINIPMAKAALAQILKWGVANIQETLAVLTSQMTGMARERGLHVTDGNHAGHMIGITLDEDKVKTLGTKLREHNVYVGFRGASMRVAPHLYNDGEDVRNLFRLL